MSFPGENGSEETLALEELPEIPEENLEAWERIEATKIQARMKRALRRLAAGASLREAARSEDYRSTADLIRYAHKHGLISMTTHQLINQFRRTSYIAMDLVEDRITNDPDSVSVKDAAIVAGIAADKVAKKEHWGQQEPEEKLGDCLIEIAKMVLQRPGKLSLDYTPEPAQASDPVESARDVTPRSVMNPQDC